MNVIWITISTHIRYGIAAQRSAPEPPHSQSRWRHHLGRGGYRTSWGWYQQWDVMISSGYDTLWLLIMPYILIYHICWWWFISIIPHYDTLWYIMIINNPICNNPIISRLKLLYLYSGKSGIIYAVCTVIKWYVWSWNLIYGIIMIEWSANKLLLLFMG